VIVRGDWTLLIWVGGVGFRWLLSGVLSRRVWLMGRQRRGFVVDMG
jgi:hypothetical protein